MLREGDHIHVTAQADDLARFMKNLQISTHPVRQTMIVGGGRAVSYTHLMVKG